MSFPKNCSEKVGGFQNNFVGIDEFFSAQNGILTDREVVSLFLYFTVNPKPQIGFLDVPRCCVFGKEAVVNRFQRAEGRWGYSGTPDRIK